jgi:hypothetical protein
MDHEAPQFHILRTLEQGEAKDAWRQACADALAFPLEHVIEVRLRKRSMNARQGTIQVQLRLDSGLDAPLLKACPASQKAGSRCGHGSHFPCAWGSREHLFQSDPHIGSHLWPDVVRKMHTSVMGTRCDGMDSSKHPSHTPPLWNTTDTWCGYRMWTHNRRFCLPYLGSLIQGSRRALDHDQGTSMQTPFCHATRTF